MKRGRHFRIESAGRKIHAGQLALATTWLATLLCAYLPAQTTPIRTEAATKPMWPPAGPAPRTSDGKPDLSGAWAPNAIRQNVDLVKTGVQVPFQAWAGKTYRDHKDNMSKDDPEGYCLPPGVPR